MQTLRFWQHVVVNFVEDGCLYRASALTFTSLLALVPLTMVGLTVFSAFPLFQNFAEDIQNFVFRNFIPSSGAMVQQYLKGFVAQASNLSIWGILFLVVTAVLMLFTIEQALNMIWQVRKRRHGISAFIIYWAILTFSPFLMGVSFALTTYFISFAHLSDAAKELGVTSYLITAVTFSLATVVLSLVYIVMPNCKVPFRFGILGAMFAALLIEFAKYGFSFYLLNFPTYELIYGALATIPIFLLWMYLLWLITLLGAEVSRMLVLRYDLASRNFLDPFCHGFRWLGHLWEAQQRGEPLSLLDLVKIDRCQYQVTPEQQIHALCQAGFVRPTEHGKFFISCDLSATTLADYQRAMPWKLPESIEAVAVGIKPREACLMPYLEKMQQALTDNFSLSLAALFKCSN